MEEIIKGRHVHLIPIDSSEKDFFYQKSTNSDASEQWLKITRNSRNKKEFFSSWDSKYFTDNYNLQGRAFHIVHNDKRIGQITYHKIDKGEVTVDILIYDQCNRNHGYGTSALKLMCAYLEEKYHVQKIWMDMPASNHCAIKAYENAGFTLHDGSQDNSIHLEK